MIDLNLCFPPSCGGNPQKWDGHVTVNISRYVGRYLRPAMETNIWWPEGQWEIAVAKGTLRGSPSGNVYAPLPRFIFGSDVLSLSRVVVHSLPNGRWVTTRRPPCPMGNTRVRRYGTETGDGRAPSEKKRFPRKLLPYLVQVFFFYSRERLRSMYLER